MQPATAAAVATGLMAGCLLGAAPAGATTDPCVAANGAERVQKGIPDCDATAQGRWRSPRATAIASDDLSWASAAHGDNNTAMATSDGCIASAEGGGAADTC